MHVTGTCSGGEACASRKCAKYKCTKFKACQLRNDLPEKLKLINSFKALKTTENTFGIRYGHFIAVENCCCSVCIFALLVCFLK